MPAIWRLAMPSLAVLAVTLSAMAPACADLAAGMFAYDQGDYATALAEWLPLAESGDPTAQGLLGLLYRGTPGIPTDHVASARWYRRAAEQGHPHAQYNLGLAYLSGQGVEPDDVQAYMWLNLAARGIPADADGTNSASRRRDALALRMTAAEIAEAARRSEERSAAR